MTRPRFLLICGVLAPCACKTSAPAPELPASAPPAPTAPSAATQDEAPPLEATPRQAVLALLSDGRSAAALELSATDQGREFDANLAEKLTPFIRLTRAPNVRQKPLTVTGRAEKDVIRRIVRAHINEVRFCYHEGLTRDAGLRGRVVVDFQILETGAVGQSAVQPSTLADKDVGECIAEAVKRWTFPKPVEGAVQVSYAFELDPG